MSHIEEILNSIEVGCFFSSHFVIDCLLKNHSDYYLSLAKEIDSADNLTLRLHQKIGHLIAAFQGVLVERQPAQSWSTNIHGNGSSCALWKRI